jgi:hypothetical protein
MVRKYYLYKTWSKNVWKPMRSKRYGNRLTVSTYSGAVRIKNSVERFLRKVGNDKVKIVVSKKRF